MFGNDSTTMKCAKLSTGVVELRPLPVLVGYLRVPFMNRFVPTLHRCLVLKVALIGFLPNIVKLHYLNIFAKKWIIIMNQIPTIEICMYYFYLEIQ